MLSFHSDVWQLFGIYHPEMWLYLLSFGGSGGVAGYDVDSMAL